MAYIENIDEINLRLDPIDVLNFIGYEKSNPEKKGSEIRDYCPIHGGDNQKSLAIDQDKKVFFCHSCQAKGDLVSLYQQAKQTKFPEAIEALASHFQINIEHETKNRQSPLNYSQSKPSINRQVPKTEQKAKPEKSAANAWNEAKERTGYIHPYFVRKDVIPCPGLRYGYDAKRNYSIIIPFTDVEGELKTVQYVHDGGKFFLKDHSPSFAFFPIGTFSDGDTVYLAEGLATALTITEGIRGESVISFGSCNNMAKVVTALKEKYPNLKMIICLDDNAAALKAAQGISHLESVSFRKPSFEGLQKTENDADFNDLKKLANIQIVRDQLQKVFTLPVEENILTEHSNETLTDSTKKSSGKCESIGDALKKSGFLERIKNKIIEYRETGIVKLSGIPTNFKKLDDLIDGLQGGHLILLAGRTSMGKTYAALNVLKNISIEQKIPASLFSLEMSNQQVFYRLISLCCGVPATKIKRGTIDDNEFAKVEEAIKKIENSPLYITDDPANSNLSILYSNIVRSCSQGETKAVFIDHIGLVNCGLDFKDNRATELGTISMKFKLLAKQYDIPLFCLAQLNREADKKDDPILSQLRDSGELEQNADIVIFIHRRDYFDPNDKPGQAKIIIAKNRDGDTGNVVFDYDKSIWLLKEQLPISELRKENEIFDGLPSHKY